MKREYKEHYKTYKGQLIAVNSPYSFRGYNAVLLYSPVEGCELYFKRVSYAKRHLDRLRNIKPIENDIPF